MQLNTLTPTRLVLALESEVDFPISQLYTLDFQRFALFINFGEDRLHHIAGGIFIL